MVPLTIVLSWKLLLGPSCGTTSGDTTQSLLFAFWGPSSKCWIPWVSQGQKLSWLYDFWHKTEERLAPVDNRVLFRMDGVSPCWTLTIFHKTQFFLFRKWKTIRLIMKSLSKRVRYSQSVGWNTAPLRPRRRFSTPPTEIETPGTKHQACLRHTCWPRKPPAWVNLTSDIPQLHAYFSFKKNKCFILCFATLDCLPCVFHLRPNQLPCWVKYNNHGDNSYFDAFLSFK